MFSSWIFFTVFAALMQAIRTAGQKRLGDLGSVAISTAARAFFGLPLALLYLNFVLPEFWLYLTPETFEPRFVVSIFLCAITQLGATAFLVHLFALRNFAIGSLYSKAEIFLVALIGSLFFDEILSVVGWFSVFCASLALLFLTYGKVPAFNFKAFFKDKSARYGLLSALGFALASLFARDAAIGLEMLDKKQGAAFALVLVLFIQVLISLLWIYSPHQPVHRPLRFMFVKHVKLCLFVGVTSAAGSIGWFTAMALANASYVKVLGQLELLVIYFISIFVFREKISKYEWIGTFMLVFSILGLLLDLG